MNAIVDTFLLAGDKVMPKMHVRQAGFAYSVCGPFTKNKEWITKQKRRRFKIHLSKRIRQSLFSTWYGLWRF